MSYAKAKSSTIVDGRHKIKEEEEKTMQRTMEVKVEPQYLCSGCLSSDRQLLPLDANFELFNCLLEMYPQTMSAPTNLCWECTAILKKIKSFQQKIKLAQSVLQNLTNSCEDFQKPHISLSSLTKHWIDKVDVVCSFDEDENINERNKIATRAVRKANENRNINERNKIATRAVRKPNENRNINERNKIATRAVRKPKNIKGRLRNTNSCQSFVEDSKKHIQKVEADEEDETSADLKVELADVKSERGDELDDEDDFDPADSDYVFETEAVTNDNKKKRKKNHAYASYSHAVDIVKHSDIDLANYVTYFKNVRLTKEQMEDLGTPLENLEFRYKQRNDAVCEECNKYFNCNVNYSRHMVFVHDAKNMNTTNCQMCLAEIKGSEALKEHWLSHNEAVKCTICSELGPVEKLYMIVHMRRHRLEIYCKHCPGNPRLSSLKEVRGHYRKYHTNVICDYCKQTFKSKYKLIHHMNLTHLPIQCKICKKVFKNRGLLYKHMSEHRELLALAKSPELAYCVECNKHYSNITRYKNHLASSVVHNPRARRVASVPCPDCDKVFTKKIYMTQHRNFVHLKKFNYSCEVCHKNFLRPTMLVKHRERHHEGILPPKNKICNVCGRGFTTKTTLTKHMRTHTGEKPYKCDVCEAAFTQRTVLVQHRRRLHSLHT